MFTLQLEIVLLPTPLLQIQKDLMEVSCWSKLPGGRIFFGQVPNALRTDPFSFGRISETLNSAKRIFLPQETHKAPVSRVLTAFRSCLSMSQRWRSAMRALAHCAPWGFVKPPPRPPVAATTETPPPVAATTETPPLQVAATTETPLPSLDRWLDYKGLKGFQ